ncbi:Hypothetical protein Bdt_0350 [Bdellovibrio bacteriovorus str. Tiberius]|uniref:Uncharacterized protein n=1 Tax=Bdellovibrio bacteriovorus str. Tiberius TaxID=1069642 RepID=K7YR72_BDEBC|nr:Hypothetical protein Bdt_0350 [Bdellovibrio bacteriovorus str. Tiberius]
MNCRWFTAKVVYEISAFWCRSIWCCCESGSCQS